MDIPTDFSAIIKVAQDALKPVPIKLTGDRLLFVPSAAHSEGGKLHDLSTYLDYPTRKKGSIILFDVDSFNTYLGANAKPGETIIYVDRDLGEPSITAVLNDNSSANPGFRDFRATLQFRKTPQWKKWQAMDGKMVSQEMFSEFVEENMLDILDPPGAQMLEIVTYLQVTRAVDFKSAVNLGNGNVQFQNLESTDAKVSTGLLTIPTIFVLALAPIMGGPTFKIEARFRFRLADGKLSLGLKLQRLEDVMEQVFDDVVQNMTLETGVLMVSGKP